MLLPCCRAHQLCTTCKRGGAKCAASPTGDADADDDPAEALDLEGREAGGTRAAGRLAAVHVVTAAEAAAGGFDIADVVLPLPGARIRYPDHDTAQACRNSACAGWGPAQTLPHNVWR